MKKILASAVLVASLVAPSVLSADKAKGLNVLVNSANPQTQAMAMVLFPTKKLQPQKQVRLSYC